MCQLTCGIHPVFHCTLKTNKIFRSRQTNLCLLTLSTALYCLIAHMKLHISPPSLSHSHTLSVSVSLSLCLSLSLSLSAAATAGVWAAGSTRFASQLVWSPDPQKYLAHAVSQMQEAEVAIMQLVDEVLYGRACVCERVGIWAWEQKW